MISPLASPFRGGFRNLTPMRGRGRGGVAWSPANLAPYAWYDANIGGSSTQITDSSGNAKAAVTNGAGSNAATWLPYATPSVYLTGAASSSVSTPDSAALSFSNDIEVVTRIKCVDWSAAANQTIVGKYVTTGNQRSWRFYVSTTGVFGLTASVDGTAVTSCLVTPSVALTDNAWVWLRMRLGLTNGSNSVGTLETAADTGSNDDIPTVWTANGTATSTTLAGIFDSTAAVEIGSFGSGASERFNGWIGRLIVRNGFAGTTVADFNASLCGQTGYTGTIGNVWTVNRPTTGLKTVVQSAVASSARSMFLLGTDDYLDVPVGAVPAAGLSDTLTVAAVVRQHSAPGFLDRIFSTEVTGTIAGLTIRTDSSSPYLLPNMTDGTNAAQAGPTGLTLGARAVAYITVSGRSATGFNAGVNTTSPTAVSNATVAAIPAAVGRVGSRGYLAANHFSGEFEALLTFTRVLSTAEIAQLVAYYGGGS